MRTFLPFATLVGAEFLLGCQEQGSKPVGPDGPQFDKPTGACEFPDEAGHCHGGDDGGGSKAVGTLDLAGGMEAAVLPVEVKDSDERLGAHNPDFVHHIQMNFLAAYVLADPLVKDCTVIAGSNGGHDEGLTNDEWTGLRNELTAPVQRGFFTMGIDMSSLDLPSGGQGLLVQHDGTFDGPTGHTRIMLGGFSDHVDLVKVKQLDTDMFEFTGPVVVWARGVGGGGGKKSDRIIGCGGVDDNTVTATISR